MDLSDHTEGPSLVLGLLMGLQRFAHPQLHAVVSGVEICGTASNLAYCLLCWWSFSLVPAGKETKVQTDKERLCSEVWKKKKTKEKLICQPELSSVLPINAFFFFFNLPFLFVAKPTLKHTHCCWATCLDTNTGLNRKGETVGHTITALLKSIICGASLVWCGDVRALNERHFRSVG